ncbi:MULTISPECIES: GTP pyrophosphokinase family protein [Bacillaceae]|jgi:putative GTP pyrophosphokinase|uniref:GTP diphosphokinase n=5 Tax=Peribacillus TaxID=2675229 RepID=A0A098F9I3_9BACI|nr:MULTISPECIES: GTP pyrophosphokinase family protein [Bacillaceae]KOR77859.1 GTP pyrophosphokinase [Bacillus sp. FJAT-21352]KOR83989.1 GTP pyrophosphokinase [Bacillus sp. FJAT-22058]KRF49303.1 GTP pyrophosphokinase [Bacillus sp. Soil745]MBT2669467.1 GTP pyrophosphokinase family protein [Streptomyces sp. ISL-14]MDP9742337.1 putative GTP pyrophosphokinase [Bacillus sp. B2I3]MEC0273847.1 GTP pyrophosphokinase family protein [Peribacillus castrilensis]PEF37776.1 GTP pyrophosphokinase [Bacillus 
MESWDDFLAPYTQAVEELKVKLKGLRKQFERENIHSPIEFVTGRVKPIVSILDKASLKDIPIDKLGTEIQDIAGLRMMCQFVDDIEQVVELLRGRNDFEIVEERNYISHKKASGYRSYHVVIRYPVQTIHGEKNILAEIQIRTLAMNFWATIEHSLNYKYKGIFPEDIQLRLKRAAEAAFLLDAEMSQIRTEIQEAQRLFSRKKDS